ncbi:unnamed protein product [Polarella glacialis]|uniref:J domain-containing protein n=1 Tax=Polarella glacialis TaxID=89957 RepID=A0A813K2Z7_POLGL|nr:unnamed protein product [Polarella glacialis]
MAEDYYKILAVPDTASAKEVAKAYRQRARQTHPDKLPPGSSEEAKLSAKQAFQEVAKAYEVLGDANKRVVYDESRGRRPSGARPPPAARGQQAAPRPAPRSRPDAKASRGASPADDADERYEQERQGQRSAQEERQRQRQEREREAWARREREERKSSGQQGLGSHWVRPPGRPPESSPFAEGRDWWGTGWGASAEKSDTRPERQDDASDASSELSFNIGIDLDDLDLQEEPPEEDFCGEVWLRSGPTKAHPGSEAAEPLKARPVTEDGPRQAKARSAPRCCAVQ